MKKFKKSSIIVPALARIAVTAAASVSGTVAWFTATKTVTVNASSFTATYNDGNLSVSASSVQAGTNEDSNALEAVTISGNKTVTVKEGILRTDASYDATNDVLWSDVETENESPANTFESKGASTGAATGWVKNKTNQTVYGITWTYTFTYKFGADITSTYDLLFKPSLSGLTDSETTKAFQGVSGGFRIARTAGNKTIVYAPDTAKKNTYITDENGTTSTYSLTKGKTDDTPTEGSANSGNKDYLLTFTPTTANTDVSGTVRCVAWYEGTDTDHVIVDKALSTVSATLGFGVIKGAAKA